jgi:hypothetical protein
MGRPEEVYTRKDDRKPNSVSLSVDLIYVGSPFHILTADEGWGIFSLLIHCIQYTVHTFCKIISYPFLPPHGGKVYERHRISKI